MASLKFDVLIIGSGIAGLTACIELVEKGLNVGLVTKELNLEEANTYWAQGGIIYSHDQQDNDLLVEDIVKASRGTTNILAAKKLAEISSRVLQDLLINKLEVPFSRDEKGELSYTREAAHSTARIIYKEDYTGKAIQLSLVAYVKNLIQRKNLTIIEGHTAIDLITPNHHGIHLQQRYMENKVVGAYLFDSQNCKVRTVLAKQTILATGGFSSLYLHHSNSEGARGDGHAMARRAGAQMINLEFIQFHPTTFYDRSDHKRFLISEAVRGEGGVLINAAGERFMEKYHPLKELAPRDVVTISIVDEMLKGSHHCVYLDITQKGRSYLEKRFPTIFAHCKNKNVDIASSPIPVVPAAHYTCGGIKTDLLGKTTIQNLYAIGEVACTGLHGINRLASTSLLEGLTWGHIAAQNIIEEFHQFCSEPHCDDIHQWELASGPIDPSLIAQDWMVLKQTMWNYVGPKKSTERLKRGRKILSQLQEDVGEFYKNAQLDDRLIGLRNGIEVALQVIHSSARSKILLT